MLESVTSAEVQHGWTYVDPLELKPRQFDLRFKRIDPELTFAYQLAVECKNLDPRAPLIISGTSRTAEESFHQLVVSKATPYQQFGATQINREWFVRNVDSNATYYKPGSFVGKSILRLKPDKKEEKLEKASGPEHDVHARWSQALASAYELCASAISFGHKKAGDNIWTLTLPIVVVPDGSLWKASYDSGGRCTDPEPADDIAYQVNYLVDITTTLQSAKITLSNMHFMTAKGLFAFLKSIENGAAHRKWFG